MSSAQPRNVSPDIDLEKIFGNLMDLDFLGPDNEGCMETDWRGHPAQKVFVTVRTAGKKGGGSVKLLRNLLQDPKWKKHVNDLDGDKFGILHILALQKFPYVRDVISVLVEAGIDINLKSGSTQETPLLIAAIYSNLETVRGLLEHGARIDLSDWSGNTPLKAAEQCCRGQHENDTKPCHQVLKLLQEAQRKVLEDVSLQSKAETLRNRGNQAFGQGKYEEARDLYTQSIDIMEDYRAFTNRSLCAIKIGQKALREKEAPRENPKFSRLWGDEAMSDAGKAIKLQPTFVKAHYRQAVGKIMHRDFPRSKHFLKESLKACAGTNDHEKRPLVRLLKKMDDKFNIPNCISNPHASCKKEWDSKFDTDKTDWPDYFLCPYCYSPCPLPDEYERLRGCFLPYSHMSCLSCAMPLEDRIICDEDLLDEVEENIRSLILDS